jgi:micrococcal nuclease
MFVLLIVLLLAVPVLSQAEDLPNVQWLNCYDGDTCAFNVLLPAVFGTDIGVRLSGIDAPEIVGKCAQEKSLALVARDFLQSQVKAAKKVLLQNVFRDKYFRIEAVVLADAINLNQLMVQKGYAVLYSGAGPRHDWCAP